MSQITLVLASSCVFSLYKETKLGEKTPLCWQRVKNLLVLFSTSAAPIRAAGSTGAFGCERFGPE